MIDMIGKTFGELTVLERAEDHVYPSGRHDIQYKCRCSCGKEVTVLGIHLRSGHTKSCGCVRKETTKKMRTTHGMTNTPLYAVWKDMKARCLNKNRPDYMLYGGRGIKINKNWEQDFSVFYNWASTHGYKAGLSIDRIDVNGDYEPHNCRWVTQKEQCNNTRRNIVIEHNGQKHTLKEWSEITGINYGTLQSRLYRGWNCEDIFNKTTTH